MLKKQCIGLAIVFLVAFLPADSEAGCCEPPPYERMYDGHERL